jgi:hypothetical protein
MPYFPLELNFYLYLFSFESICDRYLTTDLSILVYFRLDQIFSHVSTQTEKRQQWNKYNCNFTFR